MKSFVYSSIALAVALAPAAALAADKVRLIISTKTVFELENGWNAKERGYFDKEGLDVAIIHGSGGAATLQTIITGSQDVAVGVGVLSVISAFSKGNPVTILGSSKRGTGDLYWYVPANSKIKSLKDLDGGGELAYSRSGSSTHLTTQFLLKATGVNAKLVSAGGPSSSRVQVMSGQLDTGWSVFPLNSSLLNEGKIRIIATGREATGLNGTTIRVIAANSNWLKKNRDTARRFMRALWKGTLYNYVGGEAMLRTYAKRWKLKYEDVIRAPEFTPLHETTFTPIGKLDQLLSLAKEFKRIKKPFTEQQKKDLIDIVYDPAEEL